MQACTTDGAQVKKVKDIRSKSCGGKRRMFQWVNSYFIDATAGTCVPRDFRPKEAEWCAPFLFVSCSGVLRCKHATVHKLGVPAAYGTTSALSMQTALRRLAPTAPVSRGRIVAEQVYVSVRQRRITSCKRNNIPNSSSDAASRGLQVHHVLC